jgi:hypothetical protein
VKDIRDQAEALRHYASQQKDGFAAQQAAAEIKLRAEYRIGEVSKHLDKAQGKRTDKPMDNVSTSTKKATLASHGISQKLAQRCEALTVIPRPQFDREIRAAREAGREINTAALLRKGRTEQAKRNRREKAESARKVVPAGAPPYRLVQGDFRDVAITADSVDVIITDPPYDAKLSLFDDLGQFASRVLKPGGR